MKNKVHVVVDFASKGSKEVYSATDQQIGNHFQNPVTVCVVVAAIFKVFHKLMIVVHGVASIVLAETDFNN